MSLRVQGVRLNREAKAIMALMAREVLDCETLEKVKEFVNCWVKDNGLDVENMKTFGSLEDLRNRIDKCHHKC